MANKMGNLWLMEQTSAGAFERIYLVQRYTSLIWDRYFQQAGSCELCLPATTDAVDLFTTGRFLARSNDDMICRIDKVEIQTDIEKGSVLIVTGSDAAKILDQRIIWDTEVMKGTVEAAIRQLVDDNLINPMRTSRAVPGLVLGETAGITATIDQQVSYKNLGETVRNLAKNYGFGYSITRTETGLSFQLHRSLDKSGMVIFSEQFKTLANSTFTRDQSSRGNVALVGGAGEGSARARAVTGYATGFDRSEVFVNASSLTKETKWEDVRTAYPMITDIRRELTTPYKAVAWTRQTIQVFDDNQKAWISQNYPSANFFTGADGKEYCSVYGEVCTIFSSGSPTDDTDCEWSDLIYSSWMASAGAEELLKRSEKLVFDGTAVPDLLYVYKEDYFLGDIVQAKNHFGIRADAMITEVLECEDEKGYTIEPHLTYVETWEAPEIPEGEEDLFEPQIIPMTAAISAVSAQAADASTKADENEAAITEVSNQVSTIGTVQTDGASGSTTVPSGAWTTVRTISLSKGTWILTGHVEFTAAFTQLAGMRFNSSSSAVSYAAERGTGGGGGGFNSSQIIEADEAITVTLEAYQASGSDKTVTGNTKMKAVLIGGDGPSASGINAAQDSVTGVLSIW